MLIPNVQPQFYQPPPPPPTLQQQQQQQQPLSDHPNPIYYPYNPQQLQHQHSNNSQYGQQQPPQPPPSSTPSNTVVHSNQSAPHTPSPMPSQQNIFLPPTGGPRDHGAIYQSQGPPHSYYMQQGYPPQGYMPPSPAGNAPQSYQPYNVSNASGYRKLV